MLQPARGLTPAALDAVADLERRVVRADGGRLKLGWSALRTRSGRDVEDLLWWDGDVLVGFLGLYTHAAPAVELAGMVDPAHRRRGIGSALLAAALPPVRERGLAPVLLVVPRTTPAGAAFARRHGGAPDHTEHALQLCGPPAAGSDNPRTLLRPEAPADRDAVRRLLLGAFGWVPPEDAGPSEDADPSGEGDPGAGARAEPVARAEAAGGRLALVAERDGRVVAFVAVVRDGDGAGVYGLVVDPAHQGRGIGRDVLRRVCRLALARGAARVHLEVETGNDRALGLYTSLGFTRVATEDYLTLPGRAPERAPG